MATELPRRRSKLVGNHPAERHEAEPAATSQGIDVISRPTVTEERAYSSDSEVSAPSVPPVPSPPEERQVAAAPRRRNRGPAPLITRNPRRLRTAQSSDDDMVSFNCKMSRGLRMRVRILAAKNEVDIQDVVAAALEDYLAARTEPDV